MNHRERFLELQTLLHAHRGLWQPPPFYVRRPAWCDSLPALADAVLALDDATLDRLAADPDAHLAWLGAHLPVIERLIALCAAPPLPPRDLPKPGAHFVCIEPWHGIADPEGYAGEFKDKPGVFTVAPGGEKRIVLTVTLLPS